MFKLILATISIGYTYAFLPKYGSQLQTIISSKGIISGVVTYVSEELWTDNFLVRELLFNHRYTNLDVIYFGLLVFTLLSKEDINSSLYKWKTFERFSIIEKNTKVILFVIMIIFNRNVENAI
jgi:hypothetical protein